MTTTSPLRTITPDDLYNFKYVYEPQISSDGKAILFTVSQARREEDNYDGVIWKYSDRELTPIASEGIRSSYPLWSPDSQKFLFLVSRQIRDRRTNELWVANSTGLDGKKLVALLDGKIAQPKWSPGGDSIVFLSDSPEGVEPKKGSDVKLIDRRNYRINGEGYTYNRRIHIFSVSLDSGRLRNVTKGDFDVECFDVSPDGKRLFFVTNTQPDADFAVNSDIFSIPLDDERAEIAKEMPNKGTISSLSISPDGRYIAFVGNDYRFKFNTLDQVWIFDLVARRTWRAAPNFDQSAVNSVVYDSKMGSPESIPVWGKDSRTIFFLSTTKGTCNIYSTNIDSKDAQPVTRGNHVINSFSISENGDIVYSLMNPLHLPELYLKKAGSLEDTIPITQFNSGLLSRLELSTPEKFTFRARDGVEIDAWYWPPVNGTKSGATPCVVEIHGGGGTEGFTFMHEFQCLCAQGFALATCNFRGTQGYGEKYSGDLTGHYLEKDYTDIVDLADDVVRRGWADKSKIGVYGGSYGGLLTNWIVTHEKKFAAAVTDRCLVNLYTFYGTSDDYRRIEYDYYGFYPWEDIDGYYEKSPIKYVANIVTPLMIIHSEEDYICPISEAEQLFAFMKRMNKEVLFVRFPGENHSLSRSGRPRHRTERLNLYLWWFTSHIETGRKVSKPV
jgi:dipeptidyl aminopeptidase/acylaminoacyl peptidase